MREKPTLGVACLSNARQGRQILGDLRAEATYGCEARLCGTEPSTTVRVRLTATAVRHSGGLRINFGHLGTSYVRWNIDTYVFFTSVRKTAAAAGIKPTSLG